MSVREEAARMLPMLEENHRAGGACEFNEQVAVEFANAHLERGATEAEVVEAYRSAVIDGEARAVVDANVTTTEVVVPEWSLQKEGENDGR